MCKGYWLLYCSVLFWGFKWCYQASRILSWDFYLLPKSMNPSANPALKASCGVFFHPKSFEWNWNISKWRLGLPRHWKWKEQTGILRSISTAEIPWCRALCLPPREDTRHFWGAFTQFREISPLGTVASIWEPMGMTGVQTGLGNSSQWNTNLGKIRILVRRNWAWDRYLELK